MKEPAPHQNDENKKPAFDQLCSLLNADEDTQTHGTLLLRIRNFRVPTEGDKTRRNGVPLSQLLRESKIRLVDFLEPLKAFVALLGDHACEPQVKSLEKKYVIVSIMFQKYVKIFAEMFMWEPKPEAIEQARKEKHPSEGYVIFSLGWNLYIFTKAKLLGEHVDLVEGLHLLLCVAHLLLVHASPNFRRVSLQKGPFDTRTKSVLQCIAERYKANNADLNKLDQTSFAPLLTHCCAANPTQMSEHKSLAYTPARLPTEPSLASSLFFGGMLEGANLKRNEIQFGREYEVLSYSTGEFDERLFVSDFESQIGSPSHLSSQSRSFYHVRGPFSPTSAIPLTPVAIVLDSASWLERYLQGRQSAPSSVVQQFYAAATEAPEIATRINSRVSQLVAATQANGPPNARLPRVVTFYYCLLEHLLKTEQARLKRDNFSALLLADQFHRALFFLSLQIVYFVCKEKISVADAMVVTGARAFEIVKITEGTIRALGIPQELPRGLLAHLQQTEDQILESRAWDANSPIFNMTPRLSQNARDQLVLSLLQIANSNVGLRTPDPQLVPVKVSGLEVFLKQVVRLASVRIADLCEKLSIPTPIPHLALAALVTILVNHSSIFSGRHLDQILLCAIYGVCRVNKVQLDITFRKMLEKYRNAQSTNCWVYKEVAINGPNDRGDIIKFYNTIFVPLLDKVILHFDLAGVGKQDPNSVAAQVAATAAAQPNGGVLHSPLKHTPTKVASNVYTSPQQSIAATNTPSVARVAEFSFGESPHRTLHSINNAVRGRTNTRKRLFFDGSGSYEEEKRARSGALDLVSLADAADFSLSASGGEGAKTDSESK